jgi:hypothetical protein
MNELVGVCTVVNVFLAVGVCTVVGGGCILACLFVVIIIYPSHQGRIGGGIGIICSDGRTVVALYRPDGSMGA